MREWAQEVKAAVDDYVSKLEHRNEFTSNKQTFGDWSEAFWRFMSW